MNNFFSSWSGGKDSCLALYSIINEGNKAGKLLTMLREDAEKSRSHGLSQEVLEAQANSLNIPLTTCPTTWDNYEENFINILGELKKEGFENGVFGDIDNIDHRKWVEGVCSQVDMEAYLPLWKKTRQELLDKFINAGFKAMIVSLNKEYLDQKYLGQIITKDLVKEFTDIGIDPAGENGEYHTVVIDGPIFSYSISIETGEISFHKGYCFLETKV